MSIQYEMGTTIEHKGQRWLIVRSVKSISLFEPEEGDPYLVEEHYIELRNGGGEADFIVFYHEPLPGARKVNGFRGLPPIIYSRKDFEHA